MALPFHCLAFLLSTATVVNAQTWVAGTDVSAVGTYKYQGGAAVGTKVERINLLINS